METLRRAGSAVREVVYPRRCAGCGARGAWVCDSCLRDLELFAPPWCAGCGMPRRLGICRCADLPPGVAAARAVGPFAGWLRKAIIALKYEDEPDRAGHLGHLLAGAVADLAPAALLAPVPLHQSRSKQRGYNQSALLAAAASARLGWPTGEPLERTRATGQQARLDAAGRRTNVAGAFGLAPGWDAARLTGQTVVLVDDVMTTGSTIGACAAVLSAAGAAQVFVATVARDL